MNRGVSAPILNTMETDTTAQAQSLPPFVTLKRTAKHLDISERTARRLIASGDLKAVRIGKRLLRVERESLLALARPVGGAR